jgi:uncharacterized OsmC-like protein
MVEMQITYEGGLRTQGVHGPSGDRITTDAPVDNHGRGEAFSPSDLVGAALGSCMLTVMGIFAERHGIDLKGTRATVRKGMVQEPVRRIGELTVRIELPLPTSHPHREALERVALSCPVHRSLHPDVQMPVEFAWIG